MRHVKPVSKMHSGIGKAEAVGFYPLGVVIAIIQNILLIIVERWKGASLSIPG